MKRRAKELLSGRPGEIKLDLAREDMVCTSFAKDPTLREEFREDNKENLLSDLGEGTLSILFSCNLETNNLFWIVGIEILGPILREERRIRGG